MTRTIFRPFARLAFPIRAGRSAEGFLGLAIVALVGSVVVAFLYINQSSQVASTGFDIRELDATRERLEREEQRLASESAQLRAFGRIEAEAITRLGMVPAPSPDHVRARKPPIDIDARLRDALASARSQRPSVEDRLSRWLHLSVLDAPGRDDAPPVAAGGNASPFPSLARAWEALAGSGRGGASGTPEPGAITPRPGRE